MLIELEIKILMLQKSLKTRRILKPKKRRQNTTNINSNSKKRRVEESEDAGTDRRVQEAVRKAKTRQNEYKDAP